MLTPQVLVEAVRDLDSDDVVDLVEDLESRSKKRFWTRWNATASLSNRRCAILNIPPAV